MTVYLRIPCQKIVHTPYAYGSGQPYTPCAHRTRPSCELRQAYEWSIRRSYVCPSNMCKRVQCVPMFYDCHMSRVGQNHIYTVYIRYFWLGNNQIYGVYIRIYTVLANPTHEDEAQLRLPILYVQPVIYCCFCLPRCSFRLFANFR